MNDKAKKAYNELAKKMDERDKYLFDLLSRYKKHGSIPDASVPEFQSVEHHRESFEAFKKDRFKSWRTMPKVVKRIKRAAKRASRNE